MYHLFRLTEDGWKYEGSVDWRPSEDAIAYAEKEVQTDIAIFAW
jgi:hypothetical protein